MQRKRTSIARSSTLVLRVSVLAFALAFVAVPRTSAAKAPVAADAESPTPLLGRLAHHAAQFEEMKRRGSFTLRGYVEELDGDGHVDGTKEMVVRVTATPSERLTEVVKYLEDGADKTAEARKRAEKRRGERRRGKGDKARDLRLPFLASEQARYVFRLVERDIGNPSHVRVAFSPRVPAEDAVKGSAWVDEAAGEILTMGFSLSKNPTFIEHVDVTMRFDLATPLGRAPSSVTFAARGGFLFLRKHYRGTASITDAHLGF